MGILAHLWREKMAEIGLRPENIIFLAKDYLGESSPDSIFGVFRTGDGAGCLIGVSTSHVQDAKRVGKTILGFTVGGDNSITAGSVVAPESRIPGCLFIAADRFIACGPERRDFPYSEIIVASGGKRTMAAANYDLQKMGIGNYSYAGDIYVSKFEINRQDNLNCGYDDLTIAFATDGKAFAGDIVGVWNQLERTIITK
jgi:hypothetical protein